MKVGDLIYDKDYGQGVVTRLYVNDHNPGVFITFIEGCLVFLGKGDFDCVEMLSESR